MGVNQGSPTGVGDDAGKAKFQRFLAMLHDLRVGGFGLEEGVVQKRRDGMRVGESLFCKSWNVKEIQIVICERCNCGHLFKPQGMSMLKLRKNLEVSVKRVRISPAMRGWQAPPSNTFR